MEKAITTKRRIPIEDEFMSFKVDDIVYGYMQYLATYNPKDDVLYLRKNKLVGKKKDMAELNGISVKTLNRKIDKLIELGYVAVEGTVYTFPYNKENPYKLVSREMLFNILSTYNKFSIKIYVYLLNKYGYKEMLGDEKYSFTKKELLMALGYAENTIHSGDSLISAALDNILETFQVMNIINFSKFTQINDDGKPVPRMRLKFVATDVSELTKAQVLNENTKKMESNPLTAEAAGHFHYETEVEKIVYQIVKNGTPVDELDIRGYIMATDAGRNEGDEMLRQIKHESVIQCLLIPVANKTTKKMFAI